MILPAGHEHEVRVTRMLLSPESSHFRLVPARKLALTEPMKDVLEGSSKLLRLIIAHQSCIIFHLECDAVVFLEELEHQRELGAAGLQPLKLDGAFW